MTKRLIVCRIVALLLLLFPAARPASAWDSFVGQESCEFVVEQMKEDDEVATLIIAAFVTGANFAAGRSVAMDLEEMAFWVKDYCSRHPGERFLDALVGLDEEIDRRQPAPAETTNGEMSEEQKTVEE